MGCALSADDVFYSDGVHLSEAGMRAVCVELKALAEARASESRTNTFKQIREGLK